MQKLFCLFLIVISNALNAQTISFQIKVFGSVIGRMDVTRNKQTDGNDYYTIVSNSKAKLLWINKTYHSKFEERYKDGKFISSTHIETENDKVKRWAKINFDGKLYQIDSDKGKRTVAELPAHTDVSLYFDDYKKIKRIFYVADADFNTVTHLDDNTLEFKSTDGHRNVYFYEKGEVKQMEFHLALATVYMERID